MKRDRKTEKRAVKEERHPRLSAVFDRAKTVNRSVENGEKIARAVKRYLLPAIAVGIVIVAYAAFDIDLSGQGRQGK